MNDKQLTRLLVDAPNIAAVLMNRGGWLTAPGAITMSERFPADESGPALWAVELGTDQDADPYHVLYTTADAIVGVSVRRNHAPVEQE